MSQSVYLAVPHNGSVSAEAIPGLTNATDRGGLRFGIGKGSLLCLNFNELWCQALNMRSEWGLTHFAMHHSDIDAPELWIDTLVDELDRVGADVLSAVVPLKDDRGLTTTAIGDKSGRIRRLSLTETRALPKTFSIADVDQRDGSKLLVNTGLWVCRFTDAWVEEVCFTVRDMIVNVGGKWQARSLSEDWAFSAWAADRGLKVFATRAIRVVHYGVHGFDSDGLAGRWTTDRGGLPGSGE